MLKCHAHLTLPLINNPGSVESLRKPFLVDPGFTQGDAFSQMLQGFSVVTLQAQNISEFAKRLCQPGLVVNSLGSLLGANQ
jgi:hypothetical protein